MTTTVIESVYSFGELQADGSTRVTESHRISDGRSVDFEYDCPANVDPSVVLTARAARVQSELQANEDALYIASQGAVPWTKYQFRQRFTALERMTIDAFNGSFETNAGLTSEQKAAIRTSLKDFETSGAVYRDNPSTVSGVQMYEVLGLIAPGRAAEILNG